MATIALAGNKIKSTFITLGLLRNCLSSTVSLLRWAYHDFYSYLAVRRGGTPSTFLGWCQAKVLSFLVHCIFRVDVFGAPFLDPMYEPYHGQLFDLPPRQSGRPTIVGLVPQRQANQWTSRETEAAINTLLERKAAENPDTLAMGQSFFESHLRALRRRLPTGAVPGAPGMAGEWGGEVAYAHYESSAHVILHPADAAEVVRAGWGERHPLACCAEHWLWRFYHHTLRGVGVPLPPNLVLVYAPRGAHEMAMFKRILDAAVWFHTLPQDGHDAKTVVDPIPVRPVDPNPAPPVAPAPAPALGRNALAHNSR